MVVSVLWAGVGRRGCGLDQVRAYGEGEMEHWTDRPQQFPICPHGELLDTGGLGGGEKGKERKGKERHKRQI